MTYINIGGEERPIHFGNEVAYSFQIKTGKKYLAEVNDLLTKDLAPIAAEMGTDDAGVAAVQMDIVRLTDLAFGALSYAHRHEKKPVNFDAEDVAGWLLGDMNALSTVVALLIDSIPMQTPDEATKKNMIPQESGPNGTAQLIGDNG